ncbi:histone-lysine N-methyltransferase SETMAR-like [Xylocopa sonorina]|uniref:histone-lysine N-methyltransferase SETMAR-like n=1 Tax=Xylocopa sonorina TaxID=1818115 RepID=UPI00403AFD3E
MESNKQHFRHILLFYFRKGKNAVQARKKLTDVYGEGVLTVRQCQNWFAKFRSGNFDVEDAPRSGRPVEADKDAIKALVDANRRITTREIGERLNLSNSTVYGHLKGMGLTSKLDVWVPHVLTERNLCRRVDACDSLLKRQENDPFLKRIITGDEKWVVYNNVKRKRSWSRKDEPAQSVSKANIHQKKLLPDNTTINSEVYCHQLDKLNDSLKEKRPELINRKGSTRIMRDLTQVWSLAKNFYSLNGTYCNIHHILQIWRLPTTICSGPCKIFWMAKPLPQMKMSKTT